MNIRFLLLSLVGAALSFAAQDPVVMDAAEMSKNTLVTSKRTPTAEAPAFGTGNYFRRIINPDTPRIELRPSGPSERVRHRRQAGAVLAELYRPGSRKQYRHSDSAPLRGDSAQCDSEAILDLRPVSDASFNSARTQTPTNDVLAGAAQLNTLNQPVQVRAQQMLPTGTIWNFSFNAAKFSTNSAFANFNPAITSGLNFGFQQPLLRGAGRYMTKLPITILQSRLRQSEYNIADQVLRLVNNAENAYWDVVLAREQLKVQEQNLALTEQLLKRSRRELELGADLAARYLSARSAI